MFGLKEACQKVLTKHPGEYIHIVNEFNDSYQFVLLNNGEDANSVSCIYWSPAIIKSNGELIDDAYFGHPIFQGEYTQYTRTEIENLLGNSRKAS